MNTENPVSTVAKAAKETEAPSKERLPFNQALIIIPTYNEIDNIENMVRTLYGLYPEISLLIVDDGSPDGTAEKVMELREEFQTLHILQRSGKLGLGSAYVMGFKWALEREYNYVFEMDCDFSHDPQQVRDLLSAAQTHDLAIGSRYISGIRIMNWPMRRLLLSFFASKYVKIVTGMPVLDATGGFKCFTRKALESLNLDRIFANGYSFQIELNFKLWTQGMKLKEVPITFWERREGKSKMSGGIIKEAIFGVLMLRVRKIFKQLL